jgi:hypothetical protein
VQLALSGADLGAVAEPLAIHLRGGEVSPDQVRCPPPAPAGPRRRLALPLAPGGQVLFAHHRCDGVLADPPPRIAQVGGDPRRPVPAAVQLEQPPHLSLELFPAYCPRR